MSVQPVPALGEHENMLPEPAGTLEGNSEQEQRNRNNSGTYFDCRNMFPQWMRGTQGTGTTGTLEGNSHMEHGTLSEQGTGTPVPCSIVTNRNTREQ